MYKLTDLYKQIKEEAEVTTPQYKIYCDMDGVLVDFDKGYKALTGKEKVFKTTVAKMLPTKNLLFSSI